MDFITYQLFESRAGSPTWGPEPFNFDLHANEQDPQSITYSESFSDDACDVSSCNSVSPFASVSESSVPSEVLDVPVEVVDLFVDYANTPIQACNTMIGEHMVSAKNEDHGSIGPRSTSPDCSDHSLNQSCGPIDGTRQALRKKAANREASFRYRQRLKARSLELTSQLDDALASYQRARLAYEKTEQTFDVLQNLVLNLLASKE
ncbi:hypothetical protein CSKR_111817 [Clonorchis sinensis]|uniref:BZIP domain-containing protein n=1 Tax=Clonorchis sinensis TaxID=79923 RepID=A0A8T1M5N3_CLOSI|nr:hypothetical protein CSKR_111817 [Clonorchis sinensis]